MNPISTNPQEPLKLSAQVSHSVCAHSSENMRNSEVSSITTKKCPNYFREFQICVRLWFSMLRRFCSDNSVFTFFLPHSLLDHSTAILYHLFCPLTTTVCMSYLHNWANSCTTLISFLFSFWSCIDQLCYFSSGARPGTYVQTDCEFTEHVTDCTFAWSHHYIPIWQYSVQVQQIPHSCKLYWCDPITWKFLAGHDWQMIFAHLCFWDKVNAFFDELVSMASHLD